MNEHPLHVERLPAMRVAAVRSMGNAPEQDAWARLKAWAAPRGLLREPDRHPVFGFNHPGPDPEQSVHGYELWIQVDDVARPDSEVELKAFPGGLYATATCRRFHDPAGSVSTVWRTLWEQVQSGPYRWRPTHELERPHNPLAVTADQMLELYLPIEPRPCGSTLTPGPSET
jgi:DNA gyrase inhibitor GyrI